MWESPESLWRRLKLGREEFLQRLITTLIVGGDAPRWNTSSEPDEQGLRFVELLHDLAYGDVSDRDGPAEAGAFIDEYLLPKLEDAAQNGWPDWAVLWRDRAWIIELKTEAGSHREDQLPYYLLLAAAARPGCRVDLTYITGQRVGVGAGEQDHVAHLLSCTCATRPVTAWPASGSSTPSGIRVALS